MGGELSPTLMFAPASDAPSAPAASPSVNEDRALMARLAAGDMDALGRLYDLYQANVRRFLVRLSPNVADADDAVHATFLAAYRSAASFNPSRSLRAWLFGVAANQAKRARASSARRARLLGTLRPSAWGATADPEGALAAREELGRLESALAALSEAKRAVLLLSEVEGLSGAEIAEALDIPIGTVWTRLHHARRELSGMVPHEEDS